LPHDEPFDTWTTRWPNTGLDADGAALQRAWEIVERAAGDNPFYAERLTLPTGRSAEDFRSLPTTTKTEVVADCQAVPPYGSRTVGASETFRHIVETSGTSGKGKEIYALDAADEAAIHRAEAVGFWWAGARPGTPVLLTLPVGVTAAGLWYHGGLRLIGANVLSAGSYTTERKVELLVRYGAEMVVGTPSYIERLASTCDRMGHDPRELPVRSLVVAGEPYSAAWAQMIQERWGATLHEQYGCTERIMCWACPGGVLSGDSFKALHFPEDLAYWEIIDPETNQPVQDGEWGELITTPLQADASPLVRFATRDRVQYVAPGSCACGRPVAGMRAGGVQRYDDMLKLRGVNVWPVAFDDAIFGVPGVQDYRGLVRRAPDGAEIVEIRVECEGGPPADGLLEQISDRVRRQVGLRVQVQGAAVGELSAEVPTGFVKVSRWRDERGRLDVVGS
jgi:phenylacetate-CoA ligase